MIEALFNGLINFFLFILNLIGSIFFYPIQLLLVTLVPSVGDFLSDVSGFFNNTLFPFVCWLKEVLLTITCCPRGLFSILISTFFLFISSAVLFRTFALIYRIYLFARGSKS